MSSIPLAILFSLLILAATLLLNHRRSGRKLPPGPLGLPIIGYIHMLGQLPHQTLHRLAQKHGPIMYIRLGLKPTIVVSSPDSAELFLKTHDANFASRPKNEASEWLSYVRAILVEHEEAVHSGATESSQDRGVNGNEEGGWMVGRLRAVGEAVVDVSDEVARGVEDMASRMVFGKKFDESGFDGAVKKTIELAGALNVNDFFPFLALLDIKLN